ncbi:MAG: Crp/Fnr family transcriptional regulator [Erysipelotrichaceae bacterium]|nr:Crp/Fnr family transcriptional regulator [Erysipelotrichaceae bacterium]
MKISDALFPYFMRAGQQIHYHKNDMIYMQQDDAQNLYVIIGGRVRVFIVNAMGDEVNLTTLSKGEIFGDSSFLQNSYRPTNVQAVRETELISCQIDDLYPYLTESKELTISLLSMLTQNCNYLSSLVKKAYTYNRYEKVAAFLVEQAATSQIITYTHEEIGYTVGLSRVTVTNALNSFAKKGYIENKYRKIIVKDVSGLAQLLIKD